MLRMPSSSQSRRRTVRSKRLTKKNKRVFHQSGGRGTVIDTITEPVTIGWLNSLKDTITKIKNDPNITPADKTILQNYALEFDSNQKYLIGKNDLRDWGANMAYTLGYTPGTPYTIQHFHNQLNKRTPEVMKLSIPAYIELENAIRTQFGEPSVSMSNIGSSSLWPLYILAIMASSPPTKTLTPILFSNWT